MEDISKNTNDTHDLTVPVVFELNFAEFPIAHLTKRLPKEVNKHEIKYCDTIKGRAGNPVERNWTITSSAKHGLGGPSSINVLFELMQIWKEQHFRDNKIHIGTYYNLLRRLGWDNGSKTYKQLERDLESLYGLEIIAENAFYDSERGEYVDQRYKPFTGWKMWKKHDKKHDKNDYGYIVVNPDFHEIFVRSMYQLPFKPVFFYNMTPHERKLALYLTKIFNPYKKERKSEYRRNIYQLCEQLPVYGEKHKQKHYLIQAVKSLIEREFVLLEGYKLEKDTIVFYNRQQESLFHMLYDASKRDGATTEYFFNEIIKVCSPTNDKYHGYYKWVAENIPDGIIFEYLSRARQEGKPPAKLFNHLIRKYREEQKNRTRT